MKRKSRWRNLLEWILYLSVKLVWQHIQLPLTTRCPQTQNQLYIRSKPWNMMWWSSCFQISTSKKTRRAFWDPFALVIALLTLQTWMSIWSRELFLLKLLFQLTFLFFICYLLDILLFFICYLLDILLFFICYLLNILSDVVFWQVKSNDQSEICI